MAQQLPLMDSEAPVFPPSRRPRTAAAAAGRSRARRGVGAPRALAVVADRPDIVVEIAGPDWRIDDHTKQVGLAGVAAAREALAAAVGRSAA